MQLSVPLRELSRPPCACDGILITTPICRMPAREKTIRLALTFGYFAVCFAVLFYYTKGSFFCSRPGESGHFSQTLHLTTACTLWEVLVSICGALAARKLAMPNLAPMVSTVLALAGFASIPFWIYDSGTFIFEGNLGRRELFLYRGVRNDVSLCRGPSSCGCDTGWRVGNPEGQ